MVIYILILLFILVGILNIELPTKPSVCNSILPTLPTIKLDNNFYNKINLYSTQFNKNNLVYIPNLFDASYFNTLQNKARTLLTQSNIKSSNHIFRKGSILSKDDIKNSFVNTLYSEMLPVINKIVQQKIGPIKCANFDDKSSYNILLYDKPNDFIQWHNDPNHYIGDRITVLISIDNTNHNQSDLSSAQLDYYLENNKTMQSLKMKPNSILIFNGTKIMHRATSIKNNEKRCLISFTYCTKCRETLGGSITKNIKEFVLGY